MFSEVSAKIVDKFSELTLLNKKKLRIIVKNKKATTQSIQSIISDKQLDNIIDNVNSLTVKDDIVTEKEITTSSDNKIKLIFVCIPLRKRNPKYIYNLYNCQVLLTKDYNLPILEFEINKDFKYKKFIRQECSRIYNITSNNIIDIKLYSSVNHTYCVFLNSMSKYTNIDSISKINDEFQLYKKTIFLLCETLNDFNNETENMLDTQKDYIFGNSPKISTFSIIEKFKNIHN